MITEFTEILERNTLIKNTLHHAKLKRVVILQGVIGSGKTTLLEHIALVIAENNSVPPIFIKHTTPYKQFLLDMIYQLYRREVLPKDEQEMEWVDLHKKFNRAITRESLSLVYKTFDAHPELYICVDNMHEATKHGINMFRQLLDAINPPHLICTTLNFSKLNYLVWQAEIFTIPPLSKKAVTHIVQEFIKVKGLKVESPRTFRQQIFNISGGNPLAVANKLRYCRYEPSIRKHLLSSHHHSSGRRELDMSFIIIILFVVAMMNRYIARSLGDTHLYMLSSIIAALTIGGRFVIAKGSGKDE